MFSDASRPAVVAITMGDAAGIGPEIVLKALAGLKHSGNCRYVIVGDLACLRRTASEFGIGVDLLAFDPQQPISVLDLANLPEQIPVGVDAEVTGRASGEYIEAAVK